MLRLCYFVLIGTNYFLDPKLADADEPDTRNITKTSKNHLGVDDGIFSVDIGPRIGEDDDPEGGIPQNNGVNGFVPSSRRPSVNSNFPYAPDVKTSSFKKRDY